MDNFGIISNDGFSRTPKTQTLSAAGAIDLQARHVTLNVAEGTYAVTLAAPTEAEYGLVKVIVMDDDTGTSVTLALANVYGGTAATTATFDAEDEGLAVIGTAAGWLVFKQQGVSLA